MRALVRSCGPAVLVAALVLTGRASSGGSAPATTRVVLLSLDAGSQSVLDQLQASGALKGGAFERIRAHGLVAESMTPPVVASTPISHASMFSGVAPSVHGVVGVALPGKDLMGDLRSGFAVPTATDRLWTVAQRAGKRVLCIGAPGADGASPDATCSETVSFAALSARGGPGPVAAAEDLPSRIHSALGSSPGEPDARLVTKGTVTDDAYVADAGQFADYLGAAVQLQLGRGDWDLLVVYMPLLDNLEHRYLLTDPQQVEYREEDGARRARYAQYIKAGYQRVDAILSKWLAAAPDTTFVVVSDHGMVPTFSTVVLSNALAEAGLRVGGPDAEARVISSGASAQIYVNALARFAHGVVAPVDTPRVVERIVTACRQLRDTRGRPVFSTIAAGAELDALGLGNQNAGDVYVVARPGFGVSGRVAAGVPNLVPNTLSPDARARISRSAAESRFLENGALNELSLGVHGQRPGDPRLQAMFAVIGPQVRARHIAPVSILDVAPTVLSLIGVPVPSQMTGRVVTSGQR